jgi:transcriptional regulator with XRE-family HTH domain
MVTCTNCRYDLLMKQTHSPTPRDHGGRLGALLRSWRAARGVSQLDLALRSGLSARHLSFIETGRTQPSRQALLTLAEALEIPLRDRNGLLEAGGYARVYRQTELDAEEMRHVREILRFILDRHEPYGALVLDRWWNVLMSNGAARRSLPAFTDASLWTPAPVNLLRLVLHPLGLRRFIVNWEEVSRHLVLRAHRELGGPADEPGAALLDELHRYPGVPPYPPLPSASNSVDLVLPVHLRRDGVDIRTFSTIMTLGTPQDVTLQELRLETFFPADEASDAVLRAMADPGGAA